MSINGTSYSFRIGSDVPDDILLAKWSFSVTSEWYKGGGTSFSIGNIYNGGTSGGKHGPGNSRRTYSNSGSAPRSKITAADNEIIKTAADRWSGDWYSSSGSATFYPFGQ